MPQDNEDNPWEPFKFSAAATGVGLVCVGLGLPLTYVGDNLKAGNLDVVAAAITVLCNGLGGSLLFMGASVAPVALVATIVTGVKACRLKR